VLHVEFVQHKMQRRNVNTQKMLANALAMVQKRHENVPEEQRGLIEAICHTISVSTCQDRVTPRVLLAEAPTGTGKTDAEIAPLNNVVSSSIKVLLCTSSKTLMNQMSGALDAHDICHVFLYGKATYLCQDTFRKSVAEMRNKRSLVFL